MEKHFFANSSSPQLQLLYLTPKKYDFPHLLIPVIILITSKSINRIILSIYKFLLTISTHPYI